MTLVPTRRSEFIAGMKDTIPLVLSATPFGVIYGVAALNSGLSPLAIVGMSLFVFAGSAQFLAAGLVAQGAGVGIIVLTTFFVNLRHALYGASLAPYVRNLSQRWLLPLGFWLTDESYAVVIRHYQQDSAAPFKHWYFLGSTLFMYINWQVWTVVGLLAGQRIQGLAQLGLEFALAVTFIGIVVPLIINWPLLLCALTAGGVAVLAAGLPNQLGLMVAALSAIAVGMIAETLLATPAPEPQPDTEQELS